MVIDYEIKYTYSLTNDSLIQMCGDNTSFWGISHGYGKIPSRRITHLLENIHIDDWGYRVFDPDQSDS